MRPLGWLTVSSGAVRRHFAGYTIGNYRLGLKLMLGWAAVLAISAPPAVWNELSKLGSSPALTLVLCAIYLKDSTGVTMMVALLSVVAACAAAVLGFIPTYAAFAANGGTWEGGGAAKGATLVVVTAVMMALIVMGRMRFEKLDPLFYVSCLLLSSFCFAAYWFLTPIGAVTAPSPPIQMSYTLLLICSLPLAVVLPLAFLIWPSPSGRQTRGCFARMVVNLGALSAGAVELLVQQATSAAEDGKQAEQQLLPASHQEQVQLCHNADGQQGNGVSLPANGDATAALHAHTPQQSGDQQPEGQEEQNQQQIEQKAGSPEQAQQAVVPPPPVGAAAVVDAKKAVDEAALAKLDGAIREDVGNLHMLLLVCHFEVDLYSKQRVLPIKAFQRAVGLAAAADASLGQMLRWLQKPPAPPPAQPASHKSELHGVVAIQEGVPTGAAGLEQAEASNTSSVLGTDSRQFEDEAAEGAGAAIPSDHLSVCRQLTPQLLAVAATLRSCCIALAGVVMQKKKLVKVLVGLEELERSWHELTAAAISAKGSRRATIIFMVMRGLLFTAATKVHAMFPEVAAAVESLQPGAQQAVAAHFEASAWGTALDQPAVLEDEGTAMEQADMLAEAAAVLPSEVAAVPRGEAIAVPLSVVEVAPPAGSCDSLARHSSGSSLAGSAQWGVGCGNLGCKGATGQPMHRDDELAVCRPTAPLAASSTPRGYLRRWLQRAGLGPLQLLPGLHMLVLIGIAGTLVVVKSVYQKMGGSTDWVVITVIAASERSSGRSRVRAANRLLGTCAGIAWSVLSLALAYAINGQSLNNSATKYATLSVMVSLWGGFIGLNRDRYKRIDYGWTVMSVTVPIVLVESFKATNPWDQAKWRITCVCIGIVLELLVTSLLFPVTTDMLLHDKLQAALGGLAQLVRGVAVYEAQGSDAAARNQADCCNAVTTGDGSACEADADYVAAAEAGAAEAGMLRQLGVGGDVETLEQVEARAQQVQAEVQRLVALDAYSYISPLPVITAAQQRHEAVVATKQHLDHLCDALLMVVYMREMQEARQQQHRPSLPPQHRRLVLAVGEQIAESLLALQAVLAGNLSLAAALRTLPALDELLRRLAAASSHEVVMQHQLQLGNGSKGAVGGSATAPDGDSLRVLRPGTASLLPFTAVALGSSSTLRGLYQSSVQLLMAGDTAALKAACAERRAGQKKLGAVVAAQQAAISAALHTLT